MKALITHEESQVVCKAFRERGHRAYSNDIIECSGGHPEWHIKEDFFHHIFVYLYRYDFLGAHPVCKYLANSGVRWLTSKKQKTGFIWSDEHKIYINPDRWKLMEEAAGKLKNILVIIRSIGKGYVEQPILHKYAIQIIGEKPTQIIQPWMFGHTTKKGTSLWLVGLPKLRPTNIIPKDLRTDEIHKCAPGPEREKIRSKTFDGVAQAMATQWG